MCRRILLQKTRLKKKKQINWKPIWTEKHLSTGPTIFAKLLQKLKTALLEMVYTENAESEAIKEAVNLVFKSGNVMELIVKAKVV